MILKVKLPNTNLKTIQIEINKDEMWIQTPKYNLHYYFPYKINEKSLKNKWIKQKEMLEIHMELIKEYGI